MKIILRCQFRFRKKTHDRFPTLNGYIDCERGSTIAAAAMKKKFILDGLQLAGVLENDNRKFIGTMADEIITDTENYVILHISERMSIFL